MFKKKKQFCFRQQVNGERAPTDVYKDFRTAVLDILGAEENQEALLNGVAGMGRGVNEIPGSIVSVETAPSQHKNVTVTTETPTNAELRDANLLHPNNLMGQNVTTTVTTKTTNIVPSAGPNLTNLPPVIWVIGGPGSNKAMLCIKAVAVNPGWGHFRFVTNI